jgi:F-box domain
MEAAQVPDCDFISNLPDALLHLILSFLDASEAVQTCILSKRWTHIWRTLPFLSFSGSHFVKDSNHPLEEELRRLEHFISTLLLRREPCHLLTFHLNCLSEFVGFQCRDANTWIHYAVRHNVRDLHFHVRAPNLVPDCVLTCTSLEKLNLKFRLFFRDGRYRFQDSQAIDLPNLRELALFVVDLDKNFFKQLSSGCPVLQDLNLNHGGMDDYEVSCNKLRHLRIRTGSASVSPTGEIFPRQSLPIGKISAPNLLSFWFNGKSNVLQDTIFESTSSLVDVRVHFTYSHHYDMLHKFMARISSVEKLKFFSKMLPV